jgi:hypothetical protein
MAPAEHNSEKRLEELVDRTLRALPLRRAPNNVQLRVLAEIKRREALPWWRTNFTRWPLAARGAFLIASYGFVKLAFAAVMWLTEALRSSQTTGALNPTMRWVHGSASAISTIADVAAAVVHAVPSYWLYGAASAAIALYAALFGLGAAAYRTLYIDR